MSRDFPELDQIRVAVDDAARERHLSVIRAALESARSPRIRRFRLLAVATALVLALPVIALASEDAVPGDALYPVKRMLEPVVALIDGDVAVDRRVDEVETLHERRADVDLIRERVDRAWEVVTDEHPEHASRLVRVTDELDEGDREPADRRGDPSEQSHEDDVEVVVEPSGSATDSSIGDDEGRSSRDETTTTVSDRTTSPTDGSRDR